MTGTALRIPPLALYVHLPWCVRKCPYCDFNSHTLRPGAPKGRYVDALLADLELERRRAGERPLSSVFFGGGTPSLFAPGEIGRILHAVRNGFVLADDSEVTLEANPGAVECGSLAGYRDAGVNRLSLGAQTFDAELLQVLGRIHGVDDIGRALAAARDAGFDNINIDLMYALPGQSVAGALADLEAAVALGPEHISWYQLTLEPNTVFHARPPAGMPDDDAAWEIQQAGQALLAAAGYERYETSAWARPGRRCRHNLNYWTFGDYLAVGAGAHGKVTSGDEVRRYAKTANPLAYIESLERGGSVGDSRPVADTDLVFEYMLNVLRLTDPFSLEDFTARTGQPGEQIGAELRRLRDRGLLAEAGAGRWRVSELGQRFLNDLQAAFLP